MPSPIQAQPDDEATRSDQALLPYTLGHFQWATIVSGLKFWLYRFRSIGSCGIDELSTTRTTLQFRLESWLEETLRTIDVLPTPSQARLRTKVRIDYFFAVGLLYQPSQACPSPSSDALERCLNSAMQRIQLYDNLHAQNNLALSWPGTHGIFLAGAMLVYCLWSSADIRATVSIADVAKTTRLCSSLLTLGGEWWPLAQRGKRSFEKLADSTIKLLIDQPSTSAQASSSQWTAEASAVDSFGVTTNMLATEWFDVESMLQSFLQNDFQFPDMLDALDYPSAESFDFQ